MVVGVGPGIGGAVAKRFLREGYDVVVCRRNSKKLEEDIARISAALQREVGEEHQMPRLVGYPLDARVEAEVIAIMERTERDIGVLEVVVFNVGANVPDSILTETARKFRKVWEMACFSGFLVGREAAGRMLPRGHGTIIFTGATASLRGSNGFAAFGSAKAGLRSLAQSMARELQPQGLHVCHVIIDGPVDTPPTRQFFGSLLASKEKEEFLQPDEVAASFYHLHTQGKSSWTHELDLRPFREHW